MLKLFKITFRQARILIYLFQEDLLEFVKIKDILDFLVKIYNPKRKDKHFRISLRQSFPFLLKNRYILLKNGEIKYLNKNTNRFKKITIENNTLPYVNNFTLKLIVKNNWKLKISEEAKSLIPILIEFYNIKRLE